MTFTSAGKALDRFMWWIFARFINRPSLDLAAALVVAGLLLPVPRLPDLHQQVTIITDLSPSVRRALYQTASTLAGTLMGLTLTSISVLNTSLRANLAELSRGKLTNEKQQRTAQLFFACVRALAITLIVTLVLLLTDNTEDQTRSTLGATPLVDPLPQPGSALGQSLAIAVLTLCALRLTRLVWLLGKVLTLSASPPPPSRQSIPVSDSEY